LGYLVIAAAGSKRDVANATKAGFSYEGTQTITVKQGNETYQIKNTITVDLSEKRKDITITPKGNQ